MDINGLSINPEKTEAMGKPAHQRTEGVIGTVDFGQVNLTASHKVRSLGVIVNDKLSFNDQVNSFCKSVNFHLRALLKFEITSRKTPPRP